jgi:hypothetical protein
MEEEVYEGRGGTGFIVGVELVRWCLQMLHTPARDFFSLAALWARERRGKGRGCRGLFVGEARGRNGQALKPGREFSPATVSSEGVTAGGGRRSDRWVRPVSGEREEEDTDSGVRRCWAVGCCGVGPERFPRGSNSYFSFLSSFLFSDFRFVSKSFAKSFNSNQTNS